MRKRILTLLLALIAIFSAQAQDASTLRIYIHPQGGDWKDGLSTIGHANVYGKPTESSPILHLDTTGFFTGKSTLWAAQKLGQKLIEIGLSPENIFFSRTKNGPYPLVYNDPDTKKYNRDEYEISDEVEANNIDLFLRISLNNSNSNINISYPTLLYRGTDGNANDLVQHSYDFAQTLWPYVFSNGINPTTHYSYTVGNIHGDISFYGGSQNYVNQSSRIEYQGYHSFLLHKSMGVDVQSSMRRYTPERHRLLNRDYCEHQGVRILRGIIKYYGLQPETIGYIVGTVKDLHQKFSDNDFMPLEGTNDEWLPINGAIVELYKGGKKISEYRVDNNYNGVFVFEGLEPANDYSLNVVADGYKPLFDEYKEPIIVSANETTYPMIYLESNDFVPELADNYPNPSGQEDIIYIPKLFNFKVGITNRLKDISGDVVRSVQMGDSLVLLTRGTLSSPRLYLVSLRDLTVKRLEIPEDVHIGYNPTYNKEAISDIAVGADGTLIMCNLAHNQLNDDQLADGKQRGTLRIYKWYNLDYTPVEWFRTDFSANFNNADLGHALAFRGDANYGKILTTAINKSEGADTLRLVEMTIEHGKFTKIQSYTNSEEYGLEPLPSVGSLQLRVSPIDQSNYIINATNIAPTEVALTADSTFVVSDKAADNLVGTATVGANYFKYAKTPMMVSPYIDNEDQTQGVRLINLKEGFSKPTVANTTSLGGAVIDSTCNTFATINGRDINIYQLKGNSLVKITTEGVEQPIIERGSFAYDLSLASDGDDYLFGFKLTGSAEDVFVLIVNDEDPSRTYMRSLGSRETGDNSFRVNRHEIPEGKCHWSLTVSNPQASRVKTFFTSDVTSKKATRGGVAFIRDTESLAFGKIVVSNGNSQGFDIYSPILEHEGNWHSDMFNSNNLNSPGRITAYGGKIFVSDWSDAKSGIYVFDPASPTLVPYQIFQGERQSGGEFIYDGTLIGGSVTSCDFYGTGADRKLYTFCEDYPTSGNGKKMVRYSIGTDSIISSIPDKVYENTSALMGSAYVEVLATGRGLFVAQRQNNSSNTPNSPTLVFADYDDNILFNSGDSEVKDMFFDSTGGIAINDAGNLFALSSIGNFIGIYRLSWSETNVPSFEKLYDITVPVNGEIPQLEFDIAGNLYAYTKGGGMMAFAVPDPDHALCQATTNAPSALAVYGVATGIEDATTDSQSELQVFPNPAKNTLNVESPEDILTLNLYSLNGSKVNANGTILGNKATLNVSTLSPGYYIIRVNNQSARVIKK